MLLQEGLSGPPLLPIIMLSMCVDMWAFAYFPLFKIICGSCIWSYGTHLMISNISCQFKMTYRRTVRTTDRSYGKLHSWLSDDVVQLFSLCNPEAINGGKTSLAAGLISLTAVHSVFRPCYLSVHSAQSRQYAVDFTSRSTTSCLWDLGGNVMLQYGRAYR